MPGARAELRPQPSPRLTAKPWHNHAQGWALAQADVQALSLASTQAQTHIPHWANTQAQPWAAIDTQPASFPHPSLALRPLSPGQTPLGRSPLPPPGLPPTAAEPE